MINNHHFLIGKFKKTITIMLKCYFHMLLDLINNFQHFRIFKTEMYLSISCVTKS